MNDGLGKLAIILLIISVFMILAGVMMEITNDYICENTTDIKWFVENCEVEE